MNSKPKTSQALSIVEEAIDALTRCDTFRLERLACFCERRIDDRHASLEGLSLNSEDIGRGELDLFARLLAVTKENMRIICQSGPISGGSLEYVPTGGDMGCGVAN